jgi:hypothetical protein
MSTPSSSLEAPSYDLSLSAYVTARATIEGNPLSPDELRNIDAYWRAGLYLCVGSLYLKVNPLLREPLSVLAPHWIDLPARGGQRFLLDTRTLCVFGFYRDIPAVKVWNGPLLD